MSKYNYSVKNLKENQAKAVARDASVSFKNSIEATRFLKGKTIAVASAYLEKVLEKKLAIPYKRFTDGVGHRKGSGITSGRYPQKLSKVLLDLFKSVSANASNKGLGDELRIVHFSANKASSPMHYGRHSRRVMKRTHIEIVVEEVESKKDSKTKKKPLPKKAIPKEEQKKESSKENPNQEKKSDINKTEPKTESINKEQINEGNKNKTSTEKELNKSEKPKTQISEDKDKNSNKNKESKKENEDKKE
jgi:large subunit ribosomal protein L22